jgi:hypothetical protein
MSGDSASDLIARCKARRKGGCDYPPCPTYEPKTPADYGYGSCERCGWTEPEHIIDELYFALIRAQGRPEDETPEPEKAQAMTDPSALSRLREQG